MTAVIRARFPQRPSPGLSDCSLRTGVGSYPNHGGRLCARGTGNVAIGLYWAGP